MMDPGMKQVPWNRQLDFQSHQQTSSACGHSPEWPRRLDQHLGFIFTVWSFKEISNECSFSSVSPNNEAIGSSPWISKIIRRLIRGSIDERCDNGLEFFPPCRVIASTFGSHNWHWDWEAGHSRLVDGGYSKQGNLDTRLVLCGCKICRSLHTPVKIFRVYVEALAGFRHVFNPGGLNIILKAASLK